MLNMFIDLLFLDRKIVLDGVGWMNRFIGLTSRKNGLVN